MKCRVCEREAVTKLCEYHEEAKQNVEAGYLVWNRAYGRLSWEEYLDKVKHNGQTGQWVKEIVEVLEGLRND